MRSRSEEGQTKPWGAGALGRWHGSTDTTPGPTHPLRNGMGSFVPGLVQHRGLCPHPRILCQCTFTCLGMDIT